MLIPILAFSESSAACIVGKNSKYSTVVECGVPTILPGKEGVRGPCIRIRFFIGLPVCSSLVGDLQFPKLHPIVVRL